jgi:hypothetical protein
MNPALALEQRMIEPAGLGQLLTFVGLPSKRSARELSSSSEELFRSIAAVLDQLLLRAIGTRTAASFVSVRDDDGVFGDFYQVLRALSRLANVVIPPNVIEVLIAQSFSELEADLRDQGVLKFGAAAKEQAIFTVWTLRKTSRLIAKIAAGGPPPKEAREADAKLASEFSFCAAWSQFHLDCLIAAIRLDKQIYPEVLPAIIDGLRAAVNAHGLIRQGIDLRTPRSEEPDFTVPAWDQEDQELLDSSMHDMDMESEVL